VPLREASKTSKLVPYPILDTAPAVPHAGSGRTLAHAHPTHKAV